MGFEVNVGLRFSNPLGRGRESLMEYISPSSFLQWKEDPVTLYMRKLAPKELRPPHEPQGYPAAVGSAFDAFVKGHLATEALSRGVDTGCPTAIELVAQHVNIEPVGEWERAVKHGFQIFEAYRELGECDRLKVIGLEEAHGKDEPCYVPGTDVPILGYLDCLLEGNRVLDWKVKGSGSPGSASPTPGYSRLVDTDVPGIKHHPRCSEPFEEISYKWAVQLSVYTWMVRGRIEKARGVIHELVVGKDGRLRVAEFDGILSRDFQLGLREQFVDLWTAVQNGTVIDERIDPAVLAAMP